MYIKNRQTGFTIVELLIVIVIIGILAAIVIVAYNGIQTRANNTAKINELKSIHKLFEAYKALNGQYPQQHLATTVSGTQVGYCLSTGFPNGGIPAQPSCYSLASTATLTWIFRENDASAVAIRDDLSTVGKVPSPVINFSVNNVIGPLAFYNATYIDLVTVIKGETINDCPSSTTRRYPTTQAELETQNYRLECYIRLNK